MRLLNRGLYKIEHFNDFFHFKLKVRSLAVGVRARLLASSHLQTAEVCLALAHKTKEFDTRAALLEIAYEFRTEAKRLERDERKLMVRAAGAADR
jgi:hypothetical protein